MGEDYPVGSVIGRIVEDLVCFVIITDVSASALKLDREKAARAKFTCKLMRTREKYFAFVISIIIHVICCDC